MNPSDQHNTLNDDIASIVFDIVCSARQAISNCFEILETVFPLID